MVFVLFATFNCVFILCGKRGILPFIMKTVPDLAMWVQFLFVVRQLLFTGRMCTHCDDDWKERKMFNVSTDSLWVFSVDLCSSLHSFHRI